ncbi:MULTISPECIES: hypothetical protein [Bacillus]|jgi:hypothetical protein|uniref:Bacteriocin immunity protein n=1 Tax=Bacillus amyloliquefaciens (strain ATCC 23350 / DSM 7 / BCRC 11601 / CCUG 28519 / NBRC 15535 / NRRL B-14393 / F) TaxID=692420 RepID=A0A9P1NGE3_BACAS|nr:hypothetical protein [Bacillus amyloliquefaciens]AEB62167.1 hypothetical protein LL3_00620 [Bacillus amyloliquefaciens LL3]ARW37796.1 hypothetical protein S101267_00687 [Bacillus amyloliquefaciens]AZV92043.1 hypothetical protein BUN12_3801 [Bacillus amyloliquefaciens]MBW8280414.1 hypothetical protein [Bacillus amyloliquefaciens]MCM3250346.1 hypothetical protein [Bacillus amyloliquefaciens]
MKENERIKYLLEMLNSAIQYNDSDSYNEIISELKQSLFTPKAFDTKTAEKMVELQKEYRAKDNHSSQFNGWGIVAPKLTNIFDNKIGKL